jgi:capsular polysaccharide biosynthesis protein
LPLPVGDSRIINAASHSLRKFLSYKHIPLTEESGCAIYRNPVLKSRHGVFADSSCQLIRGVWNETHHDDNFLSAKRLTEKDIASAQRLNGVYASLLGPWSQNYYHWLIQFIPRLHLISQRLPLSRIDGFLVPSPLVPFHIESLAYFGIDSSRVIPVDGPICPDECIISTIPCENRFVPGWVVSFFQAHARKSVGVGSKKIFVMRGNANRRQIVNESQVQSLLLRHEIQPVDPGSLAFEDQVSLFATSRLVCGVHGAALANLVFCSNEARVVELIPANYPYPCFGRLATALSLDYYAIFGREPSTSLVKSILPDSDIVVDLDRLASLLDRLDSES